jgi:hypothetical protein
MHKSSNYTTFEYYLNSNTVKQTSSSVAKWLKKSYK